METFIFGFKFKSDIQSVRVWYIEQLDIDTQFWLFIFVQVSKYYIFLLPIHKTDRSTSMNSNRHLKLPFWQWILKFEDKFF